MKFIMPVIKCRLFCFGCNVLVLSPNLTITLPVGVLAANGTMPSAGTVLTTNVHIDGLEQKCSNSSALALELLRSCTKPSTCVLCSVIGYRWFWITCWTDDVILACQILGIHNVLSTSWTLLNIVNIARVVNLLNTVEHSEYSTCCQPSEHCWTQLV